MNVFETIIKRRSIRNYRAIQPTKDQLYYLVQLALYSPNAGNLQDFQFIVITKRETIMALPEQCMDQAWITSAPAVIAVCSRPEIQKKWYGEAGDNFARHNAAAAAQTISLCAVEMGLSSCWVAGFDVEGVGDLLDVPDSARVECLLTIGYANEAPQAKTPPSLESHLFFDIYGRDIQDWETFNKNYSVKIERKINDIKKKKISSTSPKKAVKKAKQALSQAYAKIIDVSTTNKEEKKTNKASTKTTKR